MQPPEEKRQKHKKRLDTDADFYIIRILHFNAPPNVIQRKKPNTRKPNTEGTEPPRNSPHIRTPPRSRTHRIQIRTARANSIRATIGESLLCRQRLHFLPFYFSFYEEVSHRRSSSRNSSTRHNRISGNWNRKHKRHRFHKFRKYLNGYNFHRKHQHRDNCFDSSEGRWRNYDRLQLYNEGIRNAPSVFPMGMAYRLPQRKYFWNVREPENLPGKPHSRF